MTDLGGGPPRALDETERFETSKGVRRGVIEPFRIVPGDPRSVVVIHVPHASRLIPEALRSALLLDDAALERELDAMTDAFTDVIALQAADLHPECRPWLFINGLSRLVVDPERFPDEREEMSSVGMGAVYTRTSDGLVLRDPSDNDISGLVDRYFTPYANAFSELIDARLAANGQVTILDLHSFPQEALPYELHADGPRPAICLGTDPFHTPRSLLSAARRSFASMPSFVDVGDNSPFAGCYVPQKHLGTASDVHALMVEIRRDLYLDAAKGLVEPAAVSLAAALARIISATQRRADRARPCHDLPELLEAFGVDSTSSLARVLEDELLPDSPGFLLLEERKRVTISVGRSVHHIAYPMSAADLLDKLLILGIEVRQ